MPAPLSHPNWKTLLWNGLSLMLIAAGFWLLFCHPAPLFFAVTFLVAGVTALALSWFHPDCIQFLEGYIVLDGFLGSWCFLTVFAGGPETWDEMLYMNLSMNLVADPTVLNRYAHIYLQRLFFFFSGWDPFLGVRLFWGFLISASSTLVYIALRLLSQLRNSKTGVVAGFIGMLFFWGLPKILSHPGVTYAEFTCLFFIILGVVIYLLWLHNKEMGIDWLLLILGVVLFWAFKSKETGAALVVLVPGLLCFPKGEFRWQVVIHRLAVLGAGVLAGLALIILLDTFSLHNPFFSIRPASWVAWLTFNQGAMYPVSATNYFSYLATTPLLTCALLALFGFFALENNGGFKPGERMLWLLPLGILFLLTLVPFNDYDRYLIPLSPVLAVLAGAFFLSLEEDHKKESLFFWLVAALALGLTLLNPEVHLLPRLGAHYTVQTVSTTFLVPMAALVLIAAWVLIRRPEKVIPALILFSIAFIPLASPIAQSVQTMTSGAVRDAFWVRFDPFIQFQDQIEPTADMTMFVSTDINAREGTAGRDADSMSWMMNLYFRTNTQPEQYDVEPFNPQIILQTAPQYALVLVTEWEALDANTQGEILQARSLARDPANYLVLLTRLH